MASVHRSSPAGGPARAQVARTSSRWRSQCAEGAIRPGGASRHSNPAANDPLSASTTDPLFATSSASSPEIIKNQSKREAPKLPPVDWTVDDWRWLGDCLLELHHARLCRRKPRGERLQPRRKLRGNARVAWPGNPRPLKRKIQLRGRFAALRNGPGRYCMRRCECGN